jgi:uncharacterized protein with HEPN domain
MKNSDLQRLQHIQVYCEDIAAAIERFGKSLDVFLTDKDFYNSVSMCILQIGELANGLSKEFCEKTDNRIQWNLVRGMRNWLAHAYGDVSKEIIWDTATSDIPNLLCFCNETGASESLPGNFPG